MAPSSVTPGQAQELELKLSIDPADAPLLGQHPLVLSLQTDAVRRVDMRALYLDTADAQLAQSGFALRLRREGGAWVQTLKTAARDDSALSARGEWEFPLAGPQVDAAALASTPLARHPLWPVWQRRLTTRFVTRFRRLQWPLTLPDGSQVWLCLDQGEIQCGRGRFRRVEPLCEVEIELRTGGPGAVWKLARQLADTLNLHPLAPSKAARGHALARGERPRPLKAPATPLHPDGQAGVHQPPAMVAGALAKVLVAALPALQHNLRLIGEDDPEYVHQARVALRRMRTAWRCLAALDWPASLGRRVEDLGVRLRDAGRILGRARDADVLALETLPRLAADAEDGSLEPGVLQACLRQAAAERAQALQAARVWARGAQAGRLWLELEAFASGVRSMTDSHPLPAPLGPTSLAQWAAGACARQATRVQRAGVRLAQQTPDELHRLRIEVKRLRYCIDLWNPLWPDARANRYVAALQDLQDHLGPLQDAWVALQSLRSLGLPAEALDRLGQRHQRLRRKRLPEVAQLLTVVALVSPPWAEALGGHGRATAINLTPTPTP